MPAAIQSHAAASTQLPTDVASYPTQRWSSLGLQSRARRVQVLGIANRRRKAVWNAVGATVGKSRWTAMASNRKVEISKGGWWSSPRVCRFLRCSTRNVKPKRSRWSVLPSQRQQHSLDTSSKFRFTVTTEDLLYHYKTWQDLKIWKHTFCAAATFIIYTRAR